MSDQVKAKVVGLGGAGCNIVNEMQNEVISFSDKFLVNYSVINTDIASLDRVGVESKFLLGQSCHRGLSAGGDAERGKRIAENDRDKLSQLFEEQDLVFLVAGLGGGTGSGAGSVVAEIAAASNAMVIAFAILPFSIEGEVRYKQADAAVRELRNHCDAVITLPNDLLLQQIDKNATVSEAFRLSNEWIMRAINSLVRTLSLTGLINLDFGTLQSTFCYRGGKTLFGIAEGHGEDYVKEALRGLTLCPLLQLPDSTKKADSLLVNIIGGKDLTLFQVNDILKSVTETYSSKANVNVGAVIDPEKEQYLEICIIGTTNVLGKKPISRQKNTSTTSASHTTPHAGSPSQAQLPTNEEQSNFSFLLKEDDRGLFEKTERNLFNGEDLDIPSYIRRGIKISF